MGHGVGVKRGIGAERAGKGRNAIEGKEEEESDIRDEEVYVLTELGFEFVFAPVEHGAEEGMRPLNFEGLVVHGHCGVKSSVQEAAPGAPRWSSARQVVAWRLKSFPFIAWEQQR